MKASLYYSEMPSPIGKLTLVASQKGLAGVYTESHETESKRNQWKEDASPFGSIRMQLESYFSGTLRTFDLPLDLHGTRFQKQVWDALLEIPFGETICYGEQARRIQNPAAVRAVGAANGQNPVCIIVPCHRVIGKNGSLTGYAGGIDRKQFLLDLERLRL